MGFRVRLQARAQEDGAAPAQLWHVLRGEVLWPPRRRADPAPHFLFPVCISLLALTRGVATLAAAGKLSFPYPQQASSATPTICNFSGKTYW